MICWKLGARFSVKPAVPFFVEEILKMEAAVSNENLK